MRFPTITLLFLSTLNLSLASKDSQEIGAVADQINNATIPLADDIANDAEADDAPFENPAHANLPAHTGAIPDHLQQFIMKMHNHPDAGPAIEKRQIAAGGGVAPPIAATIATQVPTVTQFQLSGKVIPYTQTFADVPDQWPTPSKGSVGLGSIKGTYGTVRSGTN